MYLELSNIKKSFGEREVVQDLSIGINKGELLCILGSSGCGKTTTLNIIGGFLAADSGRVMLDGEDITDLPAERRPVSTVFQSYSLFPHMTVLENVTYGLKFRGYKRKDAKEKGMAYLEMVGLTDYADSHIYEISGGQQQRVALARALIVEPKLCLLDEPFSNLDAALRFRMREELRRLQKELHMTMVFVTHDQEEALHLADRIIIMEKGVVVQDDSPLNIYRNPANGFVSDFLNLDQLIWTENGDLMKLIKKGDVHNVG